MISWIMTMTRPGSDRARALFEHTDNAAWVSALGSYATAVDLKAAVAPQTTTKGLVGLDKWWRETLPASMEQKGRLTSKELCKVMEWKIKRG